MMNFFQVVIAHARGMLPPIAFQVEFPDDAVRWAFVPGTNCTDEDAAKNAYFCAIAAKTKRNPQEVVSAMECAAYEACAETAVRGVMSLHYLDEHEWLVLPAFRLKRTNQGADGRFACDEFAHNVLVAWDVNLTSLEETQYSDKSPTTSQSHQADGENAAS